MAWWGQDVRVEQFRFYNLIQNIDSLKDIFKKLKTLFDPFFMGPAPFAWYQKKGRVILNIFCSTSHQKFFITFVLHVLTFFRPVEIYWFRLISTLRLSTRVLKVEHMFYQLGAILGKMGKDTIDNPFNPKYSNFKVWYLWQCHQRPGHWSTRFS